MRSAAVIMAAGKGSRFGAAQYKLLAQVDGKPMILKTLEGVKAAGFDEIVVVIGSHAGEMRDVLAGCPVTVIENPDWEKGQSTSLAAGVCAVRDHSDNVCLLLGDQPFLQTETIRSLLAESIAFPGEVIVPFFCGKRGNPIVVPSVYYPLLLELTSGDMGGKKLLETVGYHALNVDDPGVLRDIDTVQDYKASGNISDAGSLKGFVNMNNFWKITDGNAIPLGCNTSTIAESSRFTPVGAYTTFRTYDRFGVLRLSKHLDRLEETSKLAGHDIRLDRAQLKNILTQIVCGLPNDENRIRLTIDLEKEIGTVYIAAESLKTPDARQYKEGIVCRTTEAHRDNPKAKLSSFLAKASDIREKDGVPCDEILMALPDGSILEGLSSNFFGIIGDTVYTAEEGVLSGTTRDFILKIAQKLGVPVKFQPIRLSGLENLEEAFISSTSRSILPVREIDGVAMRASVPGPVTKRLMDEFDAELKTEIEDLRN